MDLQAHLSRTENEIARLLAIGKSTKEVADLRCISEVTVQNHRANIYRKIGVQKATELCVWWFCKTFGISLDKVLRDQAIALLMLCSFTVYEFRSPDTDITRSRRQECREMRRVRSEAEYEWTGQ